MNQPAAAALLAYQVYNNEPCTRIFEDDLDLHLLNGWVYSSPKLFAMGRPVDIHANKNDILDPAVHFPEHSWNCWHCALFAGDLSLLFTFVPFELPFCSFQKRNRLRFYATNLLKERFQDVQFTAGVYPDSPDTG